MTDAEVECTACGKKTENPRHKNGHPLCVGCKNLCRDFEKHGYELFYRRLSEEVRNYGIDRLTEERLELERKKLLNITDEVFSSE